MHRRPGRRRAGPSAKPCCSSFSADARAHARTAPSRSASGVCVSGSSRRWKRPSDDITARFDIPQAGLVTPEAGDYPFIAPLLAKLREKEIGVSFASLRLDRLTPDMITATVGERTAQRHSRAGDRKRRPALRMRQEVHERPRRRKARDGARPRHRQGEALLHGRPPRARRTEDVSAITALCRRIIDETGLALTLSVNPFVPKPRDAVERGKFRRSPHN